MCALREYAAQRRTVLRPMLSLQAHGAQPAARPPLLAGCLLSPAQQRGAHPASDGSDSRSLAPGAPGASCLRLEDS